MDERDLASLAQFCADQFSQFEAAAWMDRSSADGKIHAVVAKYLSMTSWYGHEAELERIAANTDSAIANSTGFHREALAIGLDLGSFSALVRRRIALRQRNKPLLKGIGLH
ncbi:MAG: hypothetical protein HY066_16785 [Betaproteobacteria bacterium]|nr:hypothetical protein [Betaproteobacteria bacterium]